VISTFTLALSTGARPLDAARLSNLAGGVVVMKRGTAPVTRAELCRAIRDDGGRRDGDGSGGRAAEHGHEGRRA
jgi:bifunctional ADP-heptose synthase (sugar kinase/adenylyltransferase)